MTVLTVCPRCAGRYPSGRGCPNCSRPSNVPWSDRNTADQNRFRRQVLNRDGHQCVICGGTRDLRAAHIVPYHQGGSFDPANGRTLCKRHDRETDQWAR